MFYKNIISSALILLVIFSSPSLSLADAIVGYEYTKITAGSGLRAQSIVNDLSGNIYILGRFSGIDVDLDPSEGEDTHTSNGQEDVFLTKINADGSYGYTGTIGGANEDNAFQIITDSSGAIYLLGSFYGSGIDFAAFTEDGGDSDEHSAVGDSDAFLTKINSDGSYGYTKTIGGLGAYMTPQSVSIDSSGNVYIGGFFEGPSADFNPFGGVDNQSPSGSDQDAFLTKINANDS